MDEVETSEHVSDHWLANPRAEGLALPQIARLNAMATERAAKGLRVVKLSGGDPPHAPPQFLDMAAALLSSGRADALKYPPLLGVPAFRTAVAEWCRLRYDENVTAEHILAAAGGCGGLTSVLRALIGEGDGVLVPDPCWEYLPSMVRLCGGAVQTYEHPVAAGAPDWDEVIAQILAPVRAGRVKLVLFNYPLNPTGHIMPNHLLADCVRECDARGVWCVFDDVTMDFVYGAQPTGRSGLLARNCVFVRSFSKNFGLTGMRIGYVSAPPRQLERIAKAQLYTSMYPSSLVQHALAQYLTQPRLLAAPFLDAVIRGYDTKLRAAVERMARTPRIKGAMPDGGLFLFPRVPGVERVDVYQLATESGVLVASGLAFSERCAASVRIFGGAPEADLAAALDALQRLAA